MDNRMYKLVEIKREHNSKLLTFIKQDPVHPTRGLAGLPNRLNKYRRIFAFVNEEELPIIICCIKITNKGIEKMEDIFVSSVNESIITGPAKRPVLTFYSIFRTDVETNILPKELGKTLITEVAESICAEKDNCITIIKTMSPIPTLSERYTFLINKEQVLEHVKTSSDPVARFHRRNGAKLHDVYPEADMSDIRREQSFGWMAAFDYTNVLLDKDKEKK